MSISTLAKWRTIETHDEIMKKDLSQKDNKLSDIFSKQLEFGTAGIRGVMGAGTNKMNVLTVAAAADAYAKYLIENVKDAKRKGVVIGHDNRHNSSLFSETVAKVLLNNGIKAYLFENNELQPTPLVSYVIRKMKLAGGAIITASHNPKEYNGFKVYNHLGAQLMPQDTKKIQEKLVDIDPLSVERETSKKVFFIDDKLIDKYVSEVLKVRQRNDVGNIKVVFSPYHGTSAKIAPRLLEELNVDFDVVKSQMSPDPNFSKVKTANPEDGKSYFRALNLARKHKADLVITTDPDADRLGVVVKYQRRYKFLNGNETAALYLEYMLNQMKEKGTLPKDGYIVKSNVSGDLASKIAQKFGLKVYEVNVGFKNIASLIELNKNEKFIFGFEESYGFLINGDIARDKDSFQAIVGIVEMVNYYNMSGVNVFEHLKELYKVFGIHRTEMESKALTSDMTDRLLQRMSKLTSKTMIGDKKIESVEDYRNGLNGQEKTKLVKVKLYGGSWFAIRPSGTEPKVKVYVQTVGDTKQKLMDVVAFEKQVFNWIDDNTEEFTEKHFKWTSVLKYFIFISIIAGIMAFVFMYIYEGSSDAKTGTSYDAFTIAGNIANSTNRGIWFSVWAWNIFTTILSSWRLQRMLKLQGERVKIRHLVISSLMSSVISFVTPLTVGGDAIGYWYLRRKGFKRGPLIATFLSDSLLYQVRFTVQTFILIGIGWGVYADIFSKTDPEAHAALIWFIIGCAWTIFATIMIFTLTLNKRFQEFIVRNSIKFLEWLPYLTISDPGKLAATYQYEFKQMRKGMRDIWAKWWFALEMLFFALMPLFFNPVSLILYEVGWISPNINGVNGYWASIVIGDVSSTANSMSITPGGTGTGEWLNITTGKMLYGNSIYAPKATAAGLDFMWKVFYSWPWYAFSTLAIFTTVLIENRNIRYEKINKNNKLKGMKEGRKTRFVYFATGIWAIAVTAFICIFFLVFFK